LLTRRALLVSTTVIGSAALQACATLSPGQGQGSVPKPNTQADQAAPTTPATSTVVFGSSGEPITLNPLLDDTSNSRNVWELMFEGLVRPDPLVGTPTPWLAESWSTSPDGLIWTFQIRPNVKWSDGQPFTADDVKFTFQTVLDPKTKTPYRTRFDNIAAFDAPNPATFQVTLRGPDCPFLVTTMLVGILPKHVLEGTADINTDEFNSSRPLGTGPFMFKEWRRGEFVTLVANPTHWRGRPKIDQWIRRPTANDNITTQLLKTGEIDYSAIAPAAIAELSTDPNLRLEAVSSPTSIIYIAYNLDRPLFQDKHVRQALSYGVDRQGILDSVLAGEGDLVDSAIPFQSWARSDNVPKFRFDLDAARKLLAEVGWTAGPDGILQKDGSRFAFTLSIQSGDQRRVGVATIAQDAWRKLGIQVQIEQLEVAAFNAKYQQAHDFDAIIGGGLGFTIDPDQTRFWAAKEFPSGANFVHYSNPTVDRLLDEARTVQGCDTDARRALYEQFQQMLAEDQPWTFLYSARQPVIINKRIQNAAPSPWVGAGPYLTWGINDWTIAR
jgi:peptide/nickel transport system substrate-binding protein